MIPPESSSFSQSSTPINHAPAVSQQTALTTGQIEHWREHINNLHHPIIVFGADHQPILLNQALRENLSEPTPIDQPAAFLWQEICETTGKFVAEASQKTGLEISEAFPIQNKRIVLVGSVLRSGSGRFLGAVVNVADLTDKGQRLQSTPDNGAAPESAKGLVPDESQEHYQNWTSRRDQARQKMSRLSRREHQVVCLVADGLPNKSIARELDISVKTIEKHRANATRKLGVGSTPEMVRIAVTADIQQAATPPNSLTPQ